MSDKEAISLYIKYNGEDGIGLLQKHISEIGVAGVLEVMQSTSASHDQYVAEKFNAWMTQVINIANNQIADNGKNAIRKN